MIVDQVLANMKARLAPLERLGSLGKDEEAYRDFLRREIAARIATQIRVSQHQEVPSDAL
jgi:hypothetical protein